MSLPKKREAEKRSRYRRWRDKRQYGQELSRSDIKKIIDLNRTLRKDGENLGILQVGIEIVPKEYKGIAVAETSGYRIKGGGTLNMPVAIRFDYRAVSRLSREELRSIAWHELGHYIFSYYFPKIDDLYYKDFNAYVVAETFADEFAYNKFGRVYPRATAKLYAMDKKKPLKGAMAHLEEIVKMEKFRERYKKPYWMFVAEEFGFDVKPTPAKRNIVGIKPTKDVLKGVYAE